MKAIIYVRPSTPKIGLVEFGHVGWGFQISGKKFNVGSVENAKGDSLTVPANKKDF